MTEVSRSPTGIAPNNRARVPRKARASSDLPTVRSLTERIPLDPQLG